MAVPADRPFGAADAEAEVGPRSFKGSPLEPARPPPFYSLFPIPYSLILVSQFSVLCSLFSVPYSLFPVFLFPIPCLYHPAHHFSRNQVRGQAEKADRGINPVFSTTIGANRYLPFYPLNNLVEIGLP